MVNHFTHYLRPLDTRGPDFARRCSLWAAQTQLEMLALIKGSKKTIAESRALMLEADRILALLPPSRCLEEQAASFVVCDNNGQ